MWSLLCFVMFEGDLAAQSERKPEHTPTSYKTPTLAVCIPRCTEACRKERGQSRPAGAHRGGNCSLWRRRLVVGDAGRDKPQNTHRQTDTPFRRALLSMKSMSPEHDNQNNFICIVKSMEH